MIAGKHSIAAALAAAIGVTACSNAATAQALTFELNGTRFYIPPAWTITPVHSRPAYDPKNAPPENAVFKVDRSIMLGFPHVVTHPDWPQRYPEIAPPFVYELVLEPGPKDVTQPRQRPREETDPQFAKAVAQHAVDQDGFVRLGPESYVAVRSSGQVRGSEIWSVVSLTRRCRRHFNRDAESGATLFQDTRPGSPAHRCAVSTAEVRRAERAARLRPTSRAGHRCRSDAVTARQVESAW